MIRIALVAGVALTTWFLGPKSSTLVPGCIVEFESDSGASSARRSRVVALRVSRGDAPTGLVASGAFQAEFRGTILVPLRDRYRFAFEGFGSATLEIGGKQIFDVSSEKSAVVLAKKKTRLKKGANEFVLRYRSAPDGSAACRLLWSGYGFAQELVPPRVLQFESDDKILITGETARHGRALVATRQCLTCHASSELTKGGMTELRRRGRELDGVGSRFTAAWLARWIEDPKAMRPTANMPRVLHDATTAKADARDIAAWLVTLQSSDLEKATVEGGDATKGGQLYASLGCVGCHTRPDRAIDAESDRVPLTFVRGKWKSRAALAAFLEKPHEYDRYIRMPDFGLSRDEVAHLSRYLWETSTPLTAPDGAAGDAQRGRQLVEKLGCASCHPVEGLATKTAAPWEKVAMRAVNAGCAHDEGSGPRYGFSEAEKMAIVSFVARDSTGASFTNDAPIEYVERQLHELRCVACHRYDGASDSWAQHESEVEDLAGEPDPHEVDQIRPTLTWAGEKLRTEWMRALFEGKVASPRPWLKSRMPRFRSRARFLADGLAAMHGLGRTRKSEIAKPVAKLARQGSRIFGAKGHACTTCHSAGRFGATMVFESPGINVQHASSRLREDFYIRWMLDPQRFDKSTKMTKFADDKGRTQLEAFGGDARQQFGAVWQYLLQGVKITPPDETDR